MYLNICIPKKKLHLNTENANLLMIVICERCPGSVIIIILDHRSLLIYLNHILQHATRRPPPAITHHNLQWYCSTLKINKKILIVLFLSTYIVSLHVYF